jgi:hypothetical protein
MILGLEEFGDVWDYEFSELWMSTNSWRTGG